MGEVDVDDFCHYLMEMDGKTSANFSVTRFAYGRGNYQRMEIYGSKGALVYSLDVTPGVDELEVCIGSPYDRWAPLQSCRCRTASARTRCSPSRIFSRPRRWDGRHH